MNKQRAYEKLILAIEVLGFGSIMLLIWLDEYADLPHRLLGAPTTPANAREFWFETCAILLLATVIVIATLWVFRRLRFLEDFIRVCAWCRKVEVAAEWLTFEDYMKLQHDVKSTHGICPTCRANASKHKAAALADASAA